MRTKQTHEAELPADGSKVILFLRLAASRSTALGKEERLTCLAGSKKAGIINWEDGQKGEHDMIINLLERITLDPKVMVGKPVIRGTRLTVEYIVGLLAHGSTPEQIIQEYKGLTPEDIQACLMFARKSLESTVFMPLPVEHPFPDKT
jgi:uncharacterized protein (DUF433 family)